MSKPINQVGVYDSNAISVVTNLDHIRQRPTGYIGSADVAGQIHMIRELIDNSIDELVVQQGGIITLVMLRDLSKKKYQIIVQDNGRGIPPGKLVEAMTILGASGKLGLGNAYIVSGGMYGYGAKVSAALSTRDRAITSNLTSRQVGSLYLENGKIVDHTDVKVVVPYGTTIVFEPDLHFFGNSHEFMISGYIDLVKLCRQLNIFNESIDFEISTIDHLIDEKFWTTDVVTALNIIDTIKHDPYRNVEYSSLSVPDKSAYLFDIWKTNSPIIYNRNFNKEIAGPDDRLTFQLKLYCSKKSATGSTQYFVTVNNVVLPDVSGNSGSTSVLNVIRGILLPFITDSKLRNYLLHDYKFPTLYIALGIQYQGAELSGITKTSFKDAIFAKQFTGELQAMFAFEGDAQIKQLVDAILPDLELRYSQFYDTPLKKSEDKKTFTQLTFSDNYFECKSGDASKCELYLVEGTSAGNITDTRDSTYQAIYTTRGKPKNGATALDNLSANRKALLHDPIYKDILTIMNIDEKTTDIFKSARFHKLILAADADPDGSHIVATHISNFWIINPNIITSGIVYVANPPLFSMDINKNNKLFVKNKNILMATRIANLYRPAFDIMVTTPIKDIPISDETFAELCYIIEHVGEHLNIVAKQLGIPLLILERLCMAIDYLYPHVNYEKLKEFFEGEHEELFVSIQTNEIGKYVVISVGAEDFPISIDRVGETIVSYLLPILKKHKFYDLRFKLHTKFKGTSFEKWKHASMGMIYIAMQNLDSLIRVFRYKGLGQLKTEDCFSLLMNPSTRSLTQITGIGDPVYNYDLLGKNTSERKRLLTDSSVLSSSFIRQNLQE